MKYIYIRDFLKCKKIDIDLTKQKYSTNYSDKQTFAKATPELRNVLPDKLQSIDILNNSKSNLSAQ